jgi:hypothetical protein
MIIKKIILDDEQIITTENSKEKIQRLENINHIPEMELMQSKTELADAYDKLDDDTVNQDTKMSKIDFNSNLLPLEILTIAQVDSLVSLRFLPQSASYPSALKKRLVVSQNAMGRKQKVEMAVGVREYNREKRSMLDKISGVFKKDEN